MVPLHPIWPLIHVIPSTSETIISDLFTPTSYNPYVSDPLRFMSVDSSFTHGSMICLCILPFSKNIRNNVNFVSLFQFWSSKSCKSNFPNHLILFFSLNCSLILQSLFRSTILIFKKLLNPSYNLENVQSSLKSLKLT